MANLSEDAAATAILGLAADHGAGEGASMFKGWLGPATDGVRQMFTDSQFLEWLVIAETDFVFQLQGDESEGKSVVWVKREARITRCQSGLAHEFAEIEAKASSIDDPTASRPRAYP